MRNQEKHYEFPDTESRFLGLKVSRTGKTNAPPILFAYKKILSESVQNQLRHNKYPDKNLRYVHLQLFPSLLCTAKI